MSEEYLKSLIELSNEIFNKAETIKLDPTESWNEEFFKKQWFEDTNNKRKYITQSAGWYWIGCNIDFEELMRIELLKGKKLPKSACKIKELAKANYNTFGNRYLCKLDDSGSRIIYNGHQGSVIHRVRQHFTLKNENTGALGLKYYPLFQKKWVIKYFGKPHIEKISEQFKNDVTNIIGTKSGRISIENAWRAEHGWPILCKA